VGTIVSDPEANAVKATANATTALAGVVSKGLDMASAVGGYVFKIVGTVPEDLIGVLGGDYLHHQRRRNLAAMAAKTALRIEQIGGRAPELTEPSASLVVPLLQAAADENREELQDLWAALLARAMTGGGRRIRRQFFSIIEALEPSDAVVFEAVCRPPVRQEDRIIQEMNACGIERSEYQVSIESLASLNLLKPSNTNSPIVDITSLGRELWSVLQTSSEGSSSTPSQQT
jgi:hypothetical protein